MSPVQHCEGCYKPCPWHTRTCSWDCTVKVAQKNGAQVFQPNGLPLRALKADGNLYEHEHGDHKDYKFPVDSDYIGPITEANREDYSATTGKIPETEEQVRGIYAETHALIYTDGNIALTLYESCYAMWRVESGEVLYGSLWQKGNYRLTEESRKKIQEYAARPASG